MNNAAELLKGAVGRLVRLGARIIILFGSRARGDWTPWSDYDLLVIGDFNGMDYLERVRAAFDVLAELPLYIEPHPYTLDEAMRLLEKEHPTIVDALEEGVVLHDSGELEKLVAKYEELKKRGLRRSETSIILPSWE